MVNAEKNWVKSLIAKVFKKAKDDKTFASYEDYSTEEKCIGRWIDGRPLYRKTAKITTPSVAKQNLMVYSLSDECRVINIGGFLDWGTANEDANVPLNISLPFAYCATWANNNNDPNCIYMNTTYTNRPVILILEYTKSTDAENSFTTSMLN